MGCKEFSENFETFYVKDHKQKKKIVSLITKYATTSFGIQSLFEVTDDIGKIIHYETCLIDFDENHVNKKDFLMEVEFLKEVDEELWEKMSNDECTQLMISFPMDYPEEYHKRMVQRKMEELKNFKNNSKKDK